MGKPAPVVQPGEFHFAAIGLDHGHVLGMTNGLLVAGATLKWVYDPDPAKVAQYIKQYPMAKAAASENEVLDDQAVKLVASACITNERCALGLRVMEAGKDYCTYKAPLTTLKQLESARDAAARTGRKYAVYYSERLHVEAAVFANQLISQGAIGRVMGFAVVKVLTVSVKLGYQDNIRKTSKSLFIPLNCLCEPGTFIEIVQA